MPPRLILVRHAEALHNVSQQYDLPDPVLSDKGLKQCAILNEHLRSSEHQPLVEEVELIVVSPLRRTLQTAVLCFDWLINKGVPVIPHAALQETSMAPCDVGSDLKTISAEFPDLDFSSVDPLFPKKEGVYAYTPEKVVARGQAVLKWLHQRQEKVIAIVSHATFLRVGIANRFFVNADYRIFDFEEQNGEDTLKLKEIPDTYKDGGYLHRPDSEAAGILEFDFV